MNPVAHYNQTMADVRRMPVPHFTEGCRVSVTLTGSILQKGMLGLKGRVKSMTTTTCSVYFARKDVPETCLFWEGDPVGPYIFDKTELILEPEGK